MHKFRIQITRFTLVGAANFVLTFIIFTVMLKVLTMNHLTALGVAWIIGILFSYTLNFIWVFKPEGKTFFSAPLLKFFLASLLSVLFNMLVLNLLVEHIKKDPFIIQAVLTPFILLFNFATAKYWSFFVPDHNKTRQGFSS